MSNNFGYTGVNNPGDGVGESSAIMFMVKQALSRVNTTTLVKIVAVTNSGGLSQVGFVDVQPLVNQVDGANNAMPHGVLRHLPYFRLQGGANAIIIDPQVGDIGIAVFASRDISTVAAIKAQANPGSWRSLSMADGLYLGGVLNGVPTQYVQFSAAGIAIHSPSAIVLSAPDIQLNAATVEINATTSAAITAPVVAVNASASTTITSALFTVNGATALNGAIAFNGAPFQAAGGGAASLPGALIVVGDVTAGSKSLKTHVHSGVTTGAGNTGAPV